MDNDIAKIHVIEIPRKGSLPKVKSTYDPEVKYDDVDEAKFIFKKYGKAVFRIKAWELGVSNDIIDFKSVENAVMLDSLKISENVPSVSKGMIRKLVTVYWDCFAEEGIKWPILGFEFGIDTGQHTPVCCKKPRYGPHERVIILKQVKVLKHNEWIEKCASGGWGSPLVLAPKPHQEHVTDVDDLIWRM